MSHVVTMELEVKNLEALKRCCQNVPGATFHEGRTDYRWVGTWVDDSPVPRNLFATEEGYRRMVNLPREQRKKEMKDLLNKCDHVISLDGYMGEVGVFKVGDRYELTWDWAMDIRNIMGVPGHKYYEHIVNPFPAAYGAEVAKMHYEEQGWDWNEWKDSQGNIYVEALTS